MTISAFGSGNDRNTVSMLLSFIITLCVADVGKGGTIGVGTKS